MPETATTTTRTDSRLTLQHGLARSATMQEVLRELESVAQGTSGVTITGESGSGREWMAKAIHLSTDSLESISGERLLRQAMRGTSSARPFVVIECGERLGLEERLFGLLRPVEPAGSAEAERIAEGSALHLAIGGTIVLRHLPDMPARLQSRLARVLRMGEAVLLTQTGEESVISIALRPIATAERLDGEVIPELQRRVAQALIALPPLRERREDIAGLAKCLVADSCRASNITAKSISRQAIDLLTALPWRGNITELEGLLRTLVANVPGSQIRLSDVLHYVRLDGHATVSHYTGTLKEARECFERDYVAAVLDRHKGRMAEAAKTLGLQRTNLYRKVRQLSVERRSGKRHLS